MIRYNKTALSPRVKQSRRKTKNSLPSIDKERIHSTIYLYLTFAALLIRTVRIVTDVAYPVRREGTQARGFTKQTCIKTTFSYPFIVGQQ